MKHAKPVTVNGLYFKSHKAACRHFNIHPKTVRDRLKSGWSVDDAYARSVIRLETPSKWTVSWRSACYEKMPAANVTFDIYKRRRVDGWTHDEAFEKPMWAVRNPKTRKPKYLIDMVPYTSLKEAASAFGLTAHEVKKRMGKGLSLEQALKTDILPIPSKYDFETVDIAGIERTVNEHCAHYGVRLGTVQMRVKRGMSLKHAITCPTVARDNHDGYYLYRILNTKTGMSYIGLTTKIAVRWNSHWGSRNTKSTFHKPLYKAFREQPKEDFKFIILGCFPDKKSLEEAERNAIKSFDAMHPSGYNLHSGGQFSASHKHSYEVLGKKFASKADAHKHFGVSESVVHYRRKKGWSEKDTWTTPIRSREPFVIFGKEFASKADALKHFGVTGSAVHYRRKKGWSEKDAWTTKLQTRGPYEVLGKKFASKAAAARYFEVSVQVVQKRLGKGWSEKDAWTTPVGNGMNPCTVLGIDFPSQKAAAAFFGMSTYHFRKHVDNHRITA